MKRLFLIIVPNIIFATEDDDFKLKSPPLYPNSRSQVNSPFRGIKPQLHLDVNQPESSNNSSTQVETPQSIKGCNSISSSSRSPRFKTPYANVRSRPINTSSCKGPLKNISPCPSARSRNPSPFLRVTMENLLDSNHPSRHESPRDPYPSGCATPLSRSAPESTKVKNFSQQLNDRLHATMSSLQSDSPRDSNPYQKIPHPSCIQREDSSINVMPETDFESSHLQIEFVYSKTAQEIEQQVRLQKKQERPELDDTAELVRGPDLETQVHSIDSKKETNYKWRCCLFCCCYHNEKVTPKISKR
ncbi:MAG: hypothetical protein JO129_02445 [Candidatus Dependentiae bacterium]|nr:hypothetical protein [Candidatus Dependentiae bacterium]